MSESNAEGVELLPLVETPFVFLSMSFADLIELFFGSEADSLGFWNKEPVWGSLSALRVDSNGFVRNKSYGTSSSGGVIACELVPKCIV